MQHERGVVLYILYVPGNEDVNNVWLNIRSTSAPNAPYNMALNLSYLCRIINVFVLDVIVTTVVDDAFDDVLS